MSARQRLPFQKKHHTPNAKNNWRGANDLYNTARLMGRVHGNRSKRLMGLVQLEGVRKGRAGEPSQLEPCPL